MQLFFKAAFFIHKIEAGNKKETPFVSERGYIQTVITNTTLNIALFTRAMFFYFMTLIQQCEAYLQNTKIDRAEAYD
jgi:hypothetical protein